MWTLSGKREEIFASIAANRSQTRVCIKTKPGKHLFLRLIEQTAVKEMVISPGLWKTVPFKVREALEKVGVRIVVEGRRAGREAKYSEEKKQKALELLREKKTAKNISAALSIPTTAIYWWKNQAGLAKRRRKRKSKAL